MAGNAVRSLGFVLAACLASSCASPQGPAQLSSTPAKDASWSELLGLTPGQIRTRLGLSPADDTFASSGVWLDGDAVMTEANYFEVVRPEPCGQPPPGYHGRVSAMTVPGTTKLVFRDGRLSDVRGLDKGHPPQTLQDRLGMRCDINRRSNGDSGDAPLLVYGLLAAPVTVPRKLARDADRQRQWSVFGALRLGQPPPGGSEAFAAEHRQDVVLSSAEDGAVVITVKVASPYDDDAWPYRAIVREGRVVELRPYAGYCHLQADMSLRCSRRERSR
jgi:hypothetical protein